MPSYQESYFAERDLSWPKFLSRDETSDPATAPPPLPHGPILARLRRVWIEMPSARGLGTAAIAICCCVTAGVLMLSLSSDRTRDDAPSVVAVRPNPFEQAVPSPKHQSRLAETTDQQFANVERTQALETGALNVETIPAEEASNEAEELGLIVLRNLPEGVNFQEGASSGPGEWVMAAADGDIDELAAKLGEGLQRPVTADIDIISRAGLPLGTLRIELRNRSGNNLQALAPDAAAENAAPSATRAIFQSEPERQAGTQKDAAPAKPKRAAGSSKKKKPTVAEAGGKWRTSTTAHATKRKIVPPIVTGIPDEKNGDKGVETKDAQEQPGLLAKVFSIFKGNKKDASEPEPSEEATSDLDPPASGLGYGR